MTSQLKTCPFCGGEASMFGDESTGTWNVFCGNGLCPAEPGTAICFSEQEAYEAWNTRAERTCRAESHDCGDGVTGLYCSECGNYIDDNDRYCPNCGAKVVSE